MKKRWLTVLLIAVALMFAWVLCRISHVSASLTGEYWGYSLLHAIIYGKLMKTGKRLVMITPLFGGNL